VTASGEAPADAADMAGGNEGTERSTKPVPDGARVVVDNLDTGYGNHKVLHDVSVRSREGMTSVFGPNGSGKSTLLKAIAGIIPAWSGTIRHNGNDITRTGATERVREGIVTLPQDGGLFGSLSVRENLLLGAHTVEDRTTVQERLDEVYDLWPVLEEKSSKRARSLSGGQQMMLSFARAIMTGANTYLLDEPSAGLSPTLVDDMLEIIEMVADEKDAQVILVEQNVTAALTITDHVYILVQGELRFDGTPAELDEEEKLMDLYLGIG